MVVFKTREGCQMPEGGLESGNATANGLKAENFRFWSARASPFSGAAPMASLSASILSGLGRPGAKGGREEPHTGYEFPPEYCYLRTKQCPSLAGLGVRSKKIIVKDINVYALGIYVDVPAAKSALSSFKKKSEEELAKDQGFYDAVVSAASVEKTLRLVISSRLVDRKKFLEALEERLAPRLKQASASGGDWRGEDLRCGTGSVRFASAGSQDDLPGSLLPPASHAPLRRCVCHLLSITTPHRAAWNASSRLFNAPSCEHVLLRAVHTKRRFRTLQCRTRLQAGEPGVMDEFRRQFDGVHFERGLEIAFTCPDNKKLVTNIGGQQKGTIASGALCSSLFDIYLGSDPVSKDAKDTFGRSLAASFKQ
ncbi:hypothetical protein PLESTM_001332700 [Pleodorina starrii]|nr:hypothetical protein PLESTM_001332700 [Pleodorina starrii]